MHPPLKRPHPDCQSYIAAFRLCHATNPTMKFFGYCNDAKVALDKCFKEEKVRVRRENGERGRRGMDNWESEWSEIKKELRDSEL
mmetsp:Transcript_30740/g.60936  ORF Transcript_30740/g.60936 Transcript_30740/m.60936 type:complete len:85 (+) Transcript_30740:335-589(+)